MSEKYRTALMNRPFMYIESKRVAKLIKEEVRAEELTESVMNQNILQLPSIDRRKTMLKEISTRLSSLDSYLLDNFITSTSETSKGILAYAVVSTDDLFREFLQEVYLEKLLLLDLILKKNDVMRFFERKSYQSPKVAGWRLETKHRLANGYIQLLTEANMLEKIVDGHLIKRTLLSPEVAEHLKKYGDQVTTEIILGELL